MVRIDFIAGHQLLTQGAESVYEALRTNAECHWRIGRPIKPTGAEAAVYIDHMHHHPEYKAWPKRFYLLHDLGDVAVYKQERGILRQFTTVITPDEMHARHARHSLAPRWWRTGPSIFVGGWPKYDQPPAAIPPLPQQQTILYAPSWAGENEWQTLLPALHKLPVTVIVKNHPYATAPGETASPYYQRSRQAAAAMEALAVKLKMLVMPRESNVCTFFPHVQAVISDQSSVAAEFLPWGTALETGANPDGSPKPGISRWYPEVIFRPVDAILADVARGGQQLLADIEAGQGRRQESAHGSGQRIADMIWQKICK